MIPPSGHSASPAHRAAPGRARDWVPIRSLAPRHRRRIAGHLLALPQRDRYLRFGYLATDEQIRAYVERLDFDRDEVFGIFNRRLELIGMAHLAYLPPPVRAGAVPAAEFGVSVAASARGRGLGSLLFDHAVLHARNRGIGELEIHALTENAAMLKIARAAGATIERSAGEAEARVRLPPDTLRSHLGERMESGVAALDYGLKRHVGRARGLWRRLRQRLAG